MNKKFNYLNSVAREDKTLQLKKELIAAMHKSLGVVTTACKAVGCSRETFYNYYNSDPEFKKACDECHNVALDFVESKLFQQIQNGDTTASIFYLKTKGKKRGYIERVENINQNKNYNFTSDLND